MTFFKQLSSLFLLFLTTVAFSQEKIKHTVVKGETVYSIAKKYEVKPAEILDLNPKAKSALQLNMVLAIPSKGKKEEEIVATPISHDVLAKETLYGISKKYNVSIDKIKEANPIIETEGLKLGSTITIPVSTKGDVVVEKSKKKEEKVEVKKEVKPEPKIIQKQEIKSEVANLDKEIIHEVLTKETKYGISRKYGVTVQELENLNPEIKNGLPVGYKLIFKKGIKKEKATEEIAVAEVDAVQQKAVEKKAEKIEPKKQVKVVEVKPQIEDEEEEDDKEDVASSGSSQFKIVEIIPHKDEEVTPVAPLSPENMTKADFLIAKASENLGARYRSGSTGNGGFDCSGLMFATFKNIEMTLPRSSHEMASAAGTRIDRSQAQKGDLIFFATMGKGRVSHVGMVTEVSEQGEIKFIHSSTSSGVIISSVNEPYYAKRFVQVNRVLSN